MWFDPDHWSAVFPQCEKVRFAAHHIRSATAFFAPLMKQSVRCTGRSLPFARRVPHTSGRFAAPNHPESVHGDRILSVRACMHPTVSEFLRPTAPYRITKAKHRSAFFAHKVPDISAPFPHLFPAVPHAQQAQKECRRRDPNFPSRPTVSFPPQLFCIYISKYRQPLQTDVDDPPLFGRSPLQFFPVR